MNDKTESALPWSLFQIQDALKELNRFEHPWPIDAFVLPTEHQNSLIVREESDEAELAICLDRNIIDRMKRKNFPVDFNLQDLPDLATVIEELSHFNTYCSRAARDIKVSALELEVQGEVDKFAVALESLTQENDRALESAIFETLFSECRVGSWVPLGEKERYQQAHTIARNFCRRVLDRVDTRHERRQVFREFFHSDASNKLSSKI